jgi:hypothetical protein
MIEELLEFLAYTLFGDRGKNWTVKRQLLVLLATIVMAVVLIGALAVLSGWLHR